MTDPVSELLEKHNIQYRTSGRDYITNCLNPEHQDSNPSFHIDKISGVCHCFSCGYKTNIFKHFGVFTNPVPIKIAAIKDKLKALATAHNGLELPKGYTPFTQNFRGINSSTLKHFGAFYTNQVEELQDRIVFPIPDITGKIAVFVARHTLSNADPRYINYPRKIKIPLFPAKLENISSSLVLVEGIFDMLNLYSKGLTNVCCSFGTNTLTNDTELKLLPYKAQGVTNIFILYDNDKPGQEASKVLKTTIQDLGFIVEVLNLPEHRSDPAELNQEEVDSIREYINI